MSAFVAVSAVRLSQFNSQNCLVMDRLLKPKALEVLPSDAEAPSIFKYWLATFETFIEEVVACQHRTDPDVEVNKRGLLVNLLSSTVYPYIDYRLSYEEALAVLNSEYIKKKNDVFSRHLLAVHKQQPGESLQQFLQALKRLSKDCSFRSVTAEQYREDLLHDAFINGLTSNAIRQRRLEKDDLALDAAFEQAFFLDRAQQQSSSYSSCLAAAEESLTRPLMNDCAMCKFLHESESSTC